MSDHLIQARPLTKIFSLITLSTHIIMNIHTHAHTTRLHRKQESIQAF